MEREDHKVSSLIRGKKRKKEPSSVVGLNWGYAIWGNRRIYLRVKIERGGSRRGSRGMGGSGSESGREDGLDQLIGLKLIEWIGERV